jgi:signal transduction histidine kinase
MGAGQRPAPLFNKMGSLKDFISRRNTIQNKILFSFVLLSFITILLVVILVFQILSQRIEEGTTKDIIAYRDSVNALLREKQEHLLQYAWLIASASGKPEGEGFYGRRPMLISHFDLFMKEGVKIYIDPIRFAQEGNSAQKEMVKKGLSGIQVSDLILKKEDEGYTLDFDTVMPLGPDSQGGERDIVIVGFGLDDEYLETLKRKIKNDFFILHEDKIIASTLGTAEDRNALKKKVTSGLIKSVLEYGDSVIEKIYLQNKQYKVIFSPLRVNDQNKAIFGVIMSTNDLAMAKRKVFINYLAISLSLMLILTIINYFIVKTITRPLKRLTVMADQVGKGDLSQRMEVKSSDELGIMASSFNKMVESLKKEQEKLELTIQQLIHQEKFASLGEMAAGIVHEIGNPLSTIVSYSKICLNKMTDEDDRNMLRAIQEAALRIDKLGRGLLMYSRPSVEEWEDVDINKVIEESIGVVEYQFKEEKEYRIVKRLSPKLPSLKGNSGELQQVFINLFLNAFQAMPDGGALTVSTERIGELLQVKVSDTGIGIPKNDLTKIFDPFFSTKPKDKGTGLGLSITQRIVNNHMGCIKVESEIGKGTTFTITFALGVV